MNIKVPKGTKIIALDENRILISEGDWCPEASEVIDFSAKYVEYAVVDNQGNKVYGGRGFSYSTLGEKWDFVEK